MHASSQLTLREILTLVWLGAQDSSRLDEAPSTQPEVFNDLRKQALLEKFAEIITTYFIDGKYDPSCLGGTKNH